MAIFAVNITNQLTRRSGTGEHAHGKILITFRHHRRVPDILQEIRQPRLDSAARSHHISRSM